MRIDDAALTRITEAVRAAEQNTAGEIVVVVAAKSAGYEAQRAALALAVSTLAAFAAAWFLPDDVDASMIIAGGAPFVALLVYLGAGFGAVTRAVAPLHAVDDAVGRAARAAFVERGVHRTRDRSGVLVFLSLAERRVHILGDEGIHKVIGDDGWKSYVARIVACIKSGRAGDIAAVIEDVGAVLAKSFPRRADDVNELPDAVVVQR